MVQFYHASNVSKTGDGGGVEGEEIEVHIVPLREVRAWLESRSSDTTYIDPKVFAGLWLVAT